MFVIVKTYYKSFKFIRANKFFRRKKKRKEKKVIVFRWFGLKFIILITQHYCISGIKLALFAICSVFGINKTNEGNEINEKRELQDLNHQFRPMHHFFYVNLFFFLIRIQNGFAIIQ